MLKQNGCGSHMPQRQWSSRPRYARTSATARAGARAVGAARSVCSARRTEGGMLHARHVATYLRRQSASLSAAARHARATYGTLCSSVSSST